MEDPNVARQKLINEFMARRIARIKCKNKGCDNMRRNGSSRCGKCSDEYIKRIGLDPNISIL